MSELTAQKQFMDELIGVCDEDGKPCNVEEYILLRLLMGCVIPFSYMTQHQEIFDDLRSNFCIVTPATNLMLDRNYYQSLCKRFSGSPIIAEAALKALYEGREIKLFGKGNQ